MNNVVNVVNLKTGREVGYGNVTAKEAVQLAYRQLTLGDYNWWGYTRKHNKQKCLPPVKEGQYCWFCGDWAAFKDSVD